MISLVDTQIEHIIAFVTEFHYNINTLDINFYILIVQFSVPAKLNQKKSTIDVYTPINIIEKCPLMDD